MGPGKLPWRSVSRLRLSRYIKPKTEIRREIR
jgi:hypothetical protein